MSTFISVLVPAFKLGTVNLEEVKKECQIQFQTLPDDDNIEFIELRDKYITEPNKHYCIKFKLSTLSLQALENLIYEKNCIGSILEKSFESIQLLSNKLNDLEKELSLYYDHIKKNDKNENDLINDNIKLRQLLTSQIKFSDNFRENTEKTLNKIKEEFNDMVNEFEILRNKSSNKSCVNVSNNLRNLKHKRTPNSISESIENKEEKYKIKIVAKPPDLQFDNMDKVLDLGYSNETDVTQNSQQDKDNNDNINIDYINKV